MRSSKASTADPIVARLDEIRREHCRPIAPRAMTRADFDARRRPPPFDQEKDPGWPACVEEDALAGLANRLDAEVTNAMVYPAGSMMAWHTNSDRPGRRRYYTWSEQGGGVFRYLDPATGEVVDDEEPAGWLIREFTIPDRGVLWHTIFAPVERWSFGFLLP